MYSNAMNCLNETSIINKSLPPVAAATATTNAKSLLIRAPNGTIGSGSISNSIIQSGVNNNHQENIDANNGQKLMQLVEKIWNQISIHQRKSSSTMVNGNNGSSSNNGTNNNNNKNVLATKDNNHNHHAHHHNEWSKRNNNDRSGGGGAGSGSGGGMVNDCRRIMNHNKMNMVKPKYRNNQHHIQKKLPPPPMSLPGPSSSNQTTTTIRMSSTSRTSSSCSSAATVVATKMMDDVQCVKCEYHFVDGQIVSKTKCTHQKKVPSQSMDIVENVGDSKPTKQQQLYGGGGGGSNSKIVSGMAATTYQHYQLNSNNNNKNNPNETKPGTTTTPTLTIPTTATGSSNNSSANAPTTMVDINRQCIIQANISHQSIKKYIEAEIIFDNKNMIGVIPVAKVLDDVKIAEEEPEQQPEPEKEEEEMEVEAAETEEVVEEKEVVAENAALDDNDDIVMAVEALGIEDTRENGNVPTTTSLKTTTAVTNNKGGMVVELNDDKKKNDGTTTGSSNSAPIQTNGCLAERCLKKIKCLITSFATIYEESDLTGRFVNLADIGFKNFDGNNIGLYKNIGYINRNETKFIQPSKDLLKLLLFGSTNPGQRATGNSAGSADHQQQPGPQDHELDLSDYYNDLDPTQRFYSKKFFYNILDTICRQDESIKNQIRAKCFHYPDGEYSSDGEDGTMSYETCAGGGGGGSGGTGGKYQTLNEHLDCCWKHKIDDAPFDGQVNIRIATSCNKDELNDKLFDALLRNNQRANKSNSNNSAGTSNSRTSNNIGHSGNTGGNSETFKRNVQSTLQQGLLKLDSYFITEVSFNSSNAE